MLEKINRQYDIIRKLKLLNLSDSLNILPHGELAILDILWKASESHPGQYITVSDIAKQLGVTLPAISRTLRKLAMKGCIQRLTDRQDRRITYVLITEYGRTVLNDNIEIITTFMNRVFSHFEPNEIDEYFNLSKKMADSITEEEKLLLKQNS
ncbi:MarR family winged helix-turn-helix transcriptional regulator [Diplocloster hominis]|uniref:MarR family winged helix-turn-helix transcriptional regulator n=1 Tax=Diplocloster hominis TaxID=3079010 RepID=UPI0031BBB478